MKTYKELDKMLRNACIIGDVAFLLKIRKLELKQLTRIRIIGNILQLRTGVEFPH